MFNDKTDDSSLGSQVQHFLNILGVPEWEANQGLLYVWL